MKKMMMLAAFAALFGIESQAQGSFQTIKGKNFTMHVYNSGDVMADASYIVETPQGLVTLEEPLFKVGVEAFNAYVKRLGKPVTARITNYHEGGTADHPVIQPEGMNRFMHEGAYDAMMKGFQQSFGDKMVARPTGKAREVKFGETIYLDKISYRFDRGAKNDFPASSILIGKKFLLMHWAPAKAHMNNLQLGNREAVAQALEALKAAKATRADYFIGSHGGAAGREAVDFRIAYLEKIQQLLDTAKDSETFVGDLKAAYPGLNGEEGLPALAKNLYQ